MTCTRETAMSMTMTYVTSLAIPMSVLYKGQGKYTAFRPRPDASLLCVLAAGLTSVQVGWHHKHAQVRDHRVSFTPASLKCLVLQKSINCREPSLILGPVGWWKCYTVKCTINCNHVSFAMFRLFVILLILSSAQSCMRVHVSRLQL